MNTPQQLRIAADIIEKNLPLDRWEIRPYPGVGWERPNGSMHLLDCCKLGWEVRIKPWTLPRHLPGFRPLEANEQWHRQDFTQNMLPEGWRPLLRDEILAEGDQVDYTFSGNGFDNIRGLVGCVAGNYAASGFRTQRPLPSPKKLVPLEACDVPPGSVIRGAGETECDGWCLVTSCSLTGIRIWSSDGVEWKWKSLMECEAQIKRPGEDWKPCSKEVDV